MSFVNEILHLMIPPVFFEVKRKLFPHKLPEIIPIPKRDISHGRMVIIGNGPSLNKSMELYLKEICDSECIMVNYSACTPMYEIIKPSVYVLSDVNWAAQGAEDSPNVKLVNAFMSKTTWPMTIVLPSSFYRWWALDILRSNPNLTIVFANAGWRELQENELFHAFDNSTVTPPSNTVLTFCLYLAIYWGYPKIYLIGADTSFPTSVYVGQRDNVVYTVDPHFYENNIQFLMSEPERKGRPYGMTMEQYMDMCHMVFYEYNLLGRYAKWKGVKVYNASEYSLIDCFERKKLK